MSFDLVFVERDEAMADETLMWTERGAAMEPLPPEEEIDLGLIPASRWRGSNRTTALCHRGTVGDRPQRVVGAETGPSVW